MRMGTRLQYDLCSHVYSHYPSTAKGSLLPPLWLKYHCRSPEKTIANAEAVHLLLSLWLNNGCFFTKNPSQALSGKKPKLKNKPKQFPTPCKAMVGAEAVSCRNCGA